MTRLLAFTVLVGIAVWPAAGDSITFGGSTHNGVVVREGGSMYYVQFPHDGSVKTVAKSSASDVALETDAAKRTELIAQWNAARGVPGATTEATAPVVSSPVGPPRPLAGRAEPQRLVIRGNGVRPAMPAPPQAQAQGETVEVVTDGVVRRLKLGNVTLREALNAMLRPLNLDYAIESGMIWISTPENIRAMSAQDLESKYYALKNSTDTLPKIVVSNLGGAQTGQFNQMAGGGFGGGLGGVGAGVGGIGGGAGGFGGGGVGGAGGIGGGLGGGVGGGIGGGAGGAGGGAGTFSNISQLFGTIDDRQVGEVPAVIGLTRPSRDGNNAGGAAAGAAGGRNTR